MFPSEVSCRSLVRVWPLAVLCFSLIALRSDAQCPKPLRQGDAVPSDATKEEYADGSVITYECVPGYVKQKGSSTITCNNGAWSQLTLICERISCGPPPEVVNGQWIVEDIKFGATATLKCDTGYKVGGKVSTMQCEAGGWNGKGFVCEAVKCPLPHRIQDGTFSPNEDKEYLLYQESVIYTCEKSFTLFGESQLKCTANGTYNAQPPECIKVNCPQPEVKFGIRVDGGPPPYGYKSYIVYKCNEGYQMKGSSSITCEKNVWSPEPPVCQKEISCGPPPEVVNGQWVVEDIKFGATATLKCNTGYMVGGKVSTMQCEAGGWNGKGFVCKGDGSGAGSLHTEIYSALVQRILMGLLISVGLSLSQ